MNVDPASVCRALLAALAASDGRRRRRKRDTTADAIGMGLKRELLERGVRDAPPAEAFEGWLVAQCEELAERGGRGAARAMAQELFAEWRFAQDAPAFREWLESGAPSADGDEG